MAPSQKAAALQVTPVEVLQAIESLYADELQPQGRILLKRLGERAAVTHAGCAALKTIPGRAATADVVPRIDVKHIRRVCEQSPLIEVVLEEGSEYCALLVGRAPSFVDPYSAEDPFPQVLWAQMAAFFGSNINHGIRLPGGRYACARSLVTANLPFLAGYSLGRVSHIVQLALSQRQILGYLEGQVVTYFASEAVVKKCCAAQLQPAWALKKDAMPVADLAQTRQCLQTILTGAGGEQQEVPLPNVKRLFRSQFQLELSETALGHCRVSDLLQDERFHDICTLRPQSNGYVVVPAIATSVADDELDKRSDRSGSVSTTMGANEESDVESDAFSPLRVGFCLDEPLTLEDTADSNFETLLGFPLMTPSPQYCLPQHLAVTHVLVNDFAQAMQRVRFCPDEPLSLEEDADDFLGAMALPTPSPSWDVSRRSPSLVFPSAVATPPPPTHSAESPKSTESGPIISLFLELGLSYVDTIDAVSDEPADSESDNESDCKRTPLFAEHLDLEVLEQQNTLFDFPLMTPSPDYCGAPRSLATLMWAHPVGISSFSLPLDL